jgi:hypothetical protein
MYKGCFATVLLLYQGRRTKQHYYHPLPGVSFVISIRPVLLFLLYKGVVPPGNVPCMGYSTSGGTTVPLERTTLLQEALVVVLHKAKLCYPLSFNVDSIKYTSILRNIRTIQIIISLYKNLCKSTMVKSVVSVLSLLAASASAFAPVVVSNQKVRRTLLAREPNQE